MASFRVIIKPSVQKDLRGIQPKTVSRIIAAIEALADEPLPPGVTKLEGAEKTFRVRVGDYRVIYELSSEKRTIEVLYVRHRRDAYR